MRVGTESLSTEWPQFIAAALFSADKQSDKTFVQSDLLYMHLFHGRKGRKVAFVPLSRFSEVHTGIENMFSENS